MKILENWMLTNDHLERGVRQPYTAVDPNERAIAHKFYWLQSLYLYLQEKFTLSKIEREKLMRWCKCLAEKLAVGIKNKWEAPPGMRIPGNRSRSLLRSFNGRSPTLATNERSA